MSKFATENGVIEVDLRDFSWHIPTDSESKKLPNIRGCEELRREGYGITSEELDYDQCPLILAKEDVRKFKKFFTDIHPKFNKAYFGCARLSVNLDKETNLYTTERFMYPSNTDCITLMPCELSDEDKKYFDDLLAKQVKRETNDEEEFVNIISPLD